ncbi:MAG: deoxyribodipyrimidine photo-lyase [Verrucomicrobia bacterium]|nr:MAG: deoxyribodipyrimidine photo-lyase [Verrucomicrobiota bacterium]
MSPEPIQLVWFKRDLRVADHRPLLEATAAGPVLGLYIYEPEILHSPEFDSAHLVFINECLAELEAAIRDLGGRLITRHGEAVAVLDALAESLPIAALWSHAETGNAITYRRDLRVAAWARRRGLPWREFRQDGVIRRLKNRDGWSARWQRLMNQPPLPAPSRLQAPKIPVESAGRLSPEAAGLPRSTKSDVQRGGMKAAVHTLESFLQHRGVDYRTAMSSPVTAPESCSRLSTYLAYGCISLRSVFHATRKRRAELVDQRETGGDVDRRWFGSIASFEARLRWHCHFMQKLEDEPRIEFENFCRVFDGLREDFTASAAGRERLERWKAGMTGYPMVDACMRAVQATGWLNFRMRAMLVSFAAYHLWLHWREPAVFLARHFLDFEPGIHFSQFQMQAGTTGINAMRMYSPAKQVIDQDPHGVFIRRWVPELAGVPDAWLAEPHLMPLSMQDRAGCRVGRDYPAPIVDHRDALAEARRRFAAVRKTPTAREEFARIRERHGSRKRTTQRKRRVRPTHGCS